MIGRLASSATPRPGGEDQDLRELADEADAHTHPVSFSHAHFGGKQGASKQGQSTSRRRITLEDGEAGFEAQGPPRPPLADGAGLDDDLDPREHAVISVFDLFSIGIGPSSSHTVGVLRAGCVLANDLHHAALLPRVHRLRVVLYGSLAATGEGHMTAEALLMGLEGAECETIDTESIASRVEEIKKRCSIQLARDTEGADGGKEVQFDFAKDLDWQWQKKLPLHPNGMRFLLFDDQGDLLAVRDAYSIGGGFTINGELQVGKDDHVGHGHPKDLAENAFYKETKRSAADAARRAGGRVVADVAASEPTRALHAPSDAPVGSLPEDASNEAARAATSAQPPAAPKDDTAAPPLDASKTLPTGPLLETSSTEPRFAFHNAASLLELCRRHNMTIAQVVFENERRWNDAEAIRERLFKIWATMDESIRRGVTSTQEYLPGILRVRRRAPGLYRRLTKGLYDAATPPPNGWAPVPGASAGPTDQLETPTSSLGPEETTAATAVIGTSRPISAFDAFKAKLARPEVGKAGDGPPVVLGRFDHSVMPVPPRLPPSQNTDFLSAYALAVNEVNASGGRLVIAPTLGAAGIIPAMLKFWLEFSSEDPIRDVQTFLLTAGAIAMLFKRGSTISAADGGCMAEVGVATSMAAAGYAAVMGASPEVIENAAEIGIEASLGLTCDPVAGQVMVPCIERNAIGVHKALVSAQLALAGDGKHVVSLDDAIRAMRATAAGMADSFKETSLSGLATSVRVPVSLSDC